MIHTRPAPVWRSYPPRAHNLLARSPPMEDRPGTVVEGASSQLPPLPGRSEPVNSFVPFRKEEIEQSVPERFEQQVARYPDRLAVRDRRQQLTYTELNAAANRIAHALLAQCGEGEEPIALLFEPGAGV